MTPKVVDGLVEIFSAPSAIEGWSVPEPGASEEEIALLASRIGRALPSELIEILRFSRAWMWREPDFDAVIFQPPEDIARDYFEPSDPMDRVVVSTTLSDCAKPYFYGPERLTFAFSDYHRFQLDEDPGVGGLSGQVLVVDIFEETIDVVAESLESFIMRGIEHLRVQRAGGWPQNVQ